MPYCSKCGVKVDDSIKTCPLCNIKIYNFNESKNNKKNNYPEYKPRVSLSNRQKRLITWQILSIIFLISFLIVLTTNLMQKGAISWAGYPMTAIGLTWLVSTLIIFFFKNPTIIITGNFIVLTGFLALLDLINGKMQWFLVLGLPIIGMVTIYVLLMYLFFRVTKNTGALLTAFFLLLLIPFCIGINLLASAYMGNIKVSWSLYVTISVFPVSIFLTWYHFHLKKIFDLKKYFHA